MLTIILPEPKVISFYHKCRTRTACTSGPILLAYQLPKFSSDIPKTDYGQFQKWKVDYSIYEIQQDKELYLHI